MTDRNGRRLSLGASLVVATLALGLGPAAQAAPTPSDHDGDGISNMAECDGTFAASQMLGGAVEPQLRPSWFGMTAGQSGVNITRDISDRFGAPAGSGAVVVTLTNANRHPHGADVFITGVNPNSNGQPTRVQITGTLGMYLDYRPDVQWYPNDTKELVVHDGTVMTDTAALTGAPLPAGFVRSTPLVGTSHSLRSPASLPSSPYNMSTMYVGEVVPVGASIGLAQVTTDFSFRSTLVNNGLWPVVNIILHPECDSDGNGIADRLQPNPRGVNDTGSTPGNTPVVVDVLANDPIGDLTVTSITQPSNGSSSINPDGTATYTPNPGWTGTDTFSYTATDEYGATITQTVTITVTAPGVEGADDSETTGFETPVTISVLANDPTPGLTVTSITQPSNGTATLNPDGTVTYVPADGFSGPDTFTYTATDEFGQTVTQTVTVLVTPLGVDDASTTPFQTPVTVEVLANDPTVGLTVTAITQPANGTAVLNADGTVTYTPADGFTGTDTLTYTATDEHGQEVTQAVTITVGAPPAPEGVDDGRDTPFQTPVTVEVLANDPTLGLTVTAITQPSHGTAVLNADGTVTYTPADGFTGTDTFTYTATDEHGQEVTQTVTITVGAPPAPEGVDDASTTPFQTPVTVEVLANDPTLGLTVTAITQPSHGVAVLNADGSVTYTPADGFTGTDTFTYTATDARGQEVTQTVTITVGAPPVQPQPEAVDDARETAYGTPVTIPVLANDPTLGLTVTAITQPSHGTAVLNPDGTVTYTPADGFTGTDTFTYTATDAHGQSVTRTVTVTVAGPVVEPGTGGGSQTPTAQPPVIGGSGGVPDASAPTSTPTAGGQRTTAPTPAAGESIMAETGVEASALAGLSLGFVALGVLMVRRRRGRSESA